LTVTLDDDQGAALLQLLWETLPRLRALELRGSGHLCAGPQTLARLHRVLTRHRGVVCGEGVDTLHLDLEPPTSGWCFGRAGELIDALAGSGLRELVLRSSKLPADLCSWAQQSGFARRLRRCELRERDRKTPPNCWSGPIAWRRGVSR
jgi:hypothetical protein